ncbi:MAG: hypothetical protein ABJM34_03010 [Parasphingorhabdus sp.]|uniref:tetratricopeptide repeat protein n=1 Tax=Parasphingorhabdus sp. TaxID=2709688 RepID=UPI00329A6F02
MKTIMISIAVAVAFPLFGTSAFAAQRASGQAAYEIGTKQSTERRYNEARISLRSACVSGHLKGCADYGELLEKGRGGPVALDAAMLVYTAACNEGDPQSCAGKGGIYFKRKDYANAMKLFTATCDQGVARGCNGAGYIYEKGMGSTVRPDLAHAIYVKSCGLGSSGGCHNVAVTTRDGTGRSASKKTALALFKQNCEQRGYANSCYAGGLLFANTDETNRMKYFKLACDGRNKSACHDRGVIYHERLLRATTSSEIALNKLQAKRHYERACQLGREKSCNITIRTARLEQQVKDRELTEEWAVKSRVAKRELNAYRPARHCEFQEFQVYSGNRASVDRANKIIDSDKECVRRWRRNEARRLNAIMVKSGGSVTIRARGAKSWASLEYKSTNGCECTAELEAAIRRSGNEFNKLTARFNRRVVKVNEILRSGR